jgi:MoaA/NifB/PqqE/SkfB family radical SAM enzyme
MPAFNRARLLWDYLRAKSQVRGLPVEYIAETTAKCNLYCPMCPRETYPQPKRDMEQDIFERLVEESGRSAEHMMLIGLGEPLLDPLIFDRIEYCARHNISTLLSTNGTLLDETACDRILRSPLENITLSFDGATKESFEYYRKGARFESVRDNFVRLARMKHERKARTGIVVQMVRMARNAPEVGDFIRFWSSIPGVDQVRVKEDETNLMRPNAGHDAGDWKHP